MSWLNDLASTLGIPATAVTIATACWYSGTVLEKEAKPEALKTIALVLKETGWSRAARPSAIIGRLFRLTFGDRHLTWKCFRRSAMATFVFCLSLAILYHAVLRLDFIEVDMKTGALALPYNSADGVEAPFFKTLLQVGLGALLLAVIPDYIALAKTRFLLAITTRLKSAPAVLLMVIADVVLSALTSLVVSLGLLAACVVLPVPLLKRVVLTALIEATLSSDATSYLSAHTAGGAVQVTDFAQAVLMSMFPFHAPQPGSHGALSFLFLSSTLLTSLWMILIFMSASVIKFVRPIHSLTIWFFDVDKHPVRTIGIVAGALVMFSSLIWAVLRAVV